jgi:hypothetical protein
VYIEGKIVYIDEKIDMKYIPVSTSIELYEFNLLCCNVDSSLKINETCVALKPRTVGVKPISRYPEPDVPIEISTPLGLHIIFGIGILYYTPYRTSVCNTKKKSLNSKGLRS